jgi:hypothetical protein
MIQRIKAENVEQFIGYGALDFLEGIKKGQITDKSLLEIVPKEKSYSIETFNSNSRGSRTICTKHYILGFQSISGMLSLNGLEEVIDWFVNKTPLPPYVQGCTEQELSRVNIVRGTLQDLDVRKAPLKVAGYVMGPGISQGLVDLWDNPNFNEGDRLGRIIRLDTIGQFTVLKR